MANMKPFETMANMKPFGTMANMKPCLKNIVHVLVAVIAQILYSIQTTTTKVALKQGMSPYVFTVYRHLVATAVMAPLALIFERNTAPITPRLFIKICICGFLMPVLEQDLYHVGLTMTTATFATTMLNLFPIFTFVLAVIFRMEKVKLKEIRSIAKIIGTIIAVCGSFVMALYKGPLVGKGKLRIGGQIHGASSNNDLVGFLLLILSCIAWAGFTIFQTIVLREYPHELSLAALICFTGAVEGTLVAMVAEHGGSTGWSIGWDWKLVAVVYSVVVTVVTYYVLGRMLKKKGPVFVTAFSPVMTVFTAMTGLFFTGEDLFLGGLIGAILIFLGLFSVLWGKSKNEVSQKANDGEQVMISCTVNVDPETQTVVHQIC